MGGVLNRRALLNSSVEDRFLVLLQLEPQKMELRLNQERRKEGGNEARNEEGAEDEEER